MAKTERTKQDVLDFLEQVISGSFGMIIFHPPLNADEDDEDRSLEAQHIFFCKDKDVLGMEAIASTHALWTIAQNYTKEEVAEFLLEDDILTFATETEGNA